MAATREIIGAVIYWAAILLALFGLVSAIMSAALFEGEERLYGAVGWALFAVGCYALGRIARVLLSR